MYDQIKEKTISVLDFILKNPAVFFNEGDIQALFYSELQQIKELKKLYETGCTLGLNQHLKESEQRYHTYLIHREYGVKGMPKSRADLVIFNSEDIKLITDPLNLKKVDNSYLVPDYIFEFGTEKSAGSSGNFDKHIENDLEKLLTATKRGFLVHIQRNYLLRGHSIANKLKYDKYTQILVEQFKNLSNSSDITPLIFKVDLGNPAKRITHEGKIQMFDGKEMVPINQKELKIKMQTLLPW